MVSILMRRLAVRLSPVGIINPLLSQQRVTKMNSLKSERFSYLGLQPLGRVLTRDI